MATFYSTSVDGSGVGLFVSPPGGVPANATYRADFDAATNASLIADFQNNNQPFAFVGGTLCKSGVPVTFQPGTAYFQALARLPEMTGKLAAVKAGQGSLSSEDQADIAALTFRVVSALRSSGAIP